MLSLRSADVAVICLLATPSAIDVCETQLTHGRALRTAADELLIVAPNDTGGALRAEAEARAAAVDADAVAADVTDGWTAWQLAGEDARSAFARVSALQLPADGWIQGDVAHVAAKVIAEPGRILIVVPSFWSDHLRNRILADTPAAEGSA